jgi:cell division protease FtsH
MEQRLQRLNSKNQTIRDLEMLGEGVQEDDDEKDDEEDEIPILTLEDLISSTRETKNGHPASRRMIYLSKNFFTPFTRSDGEEDEPQQQNDKNKKSENFEVITKSPINFNDIGGYDRVKNELKQCIDILTNYSKYANYNVRIPQGLILEGPPGNGKTLLAKGLAGEAKISFIPVSGSEFQEKYVGVGSARVRELFALAKKNKPCIIFIDEIDAIGRKRSGDGEISSSERDNTLNELLVALDGFKNNSGIFLIGATNRMDLLDPALTRPGRIDKKIFIGPPDMKTREAILRIHMKGKPADETVILADLVDLTMGLSGAQIENLLNEAMLNALRDDRTAMTHQDIDQILNRIMAGWQPSEHQFTSDIIDHIAVHEMGHALVGLLCKYHNKMTKVIINLSSPRSPGYTVFEGSVSTIYTRQALFEHLMILLAGRIAEEIFYEVTVTTGAINDFEEAFALAEKMIVYYGMGDKVIYPEKSEKYKELIDTEVAKLISESYARSLFILQNAKDLLWEGAEILKRDKLIKADKLMELIHEKYPDVLKLRMI